MNATSPQKKSIFRVARFECADQPCPEAVQQGTDWIVELTMMELMMFMQKHDPSTLSRSDDPRFHGELMLGMPMRLGEIE